jgi:putative peptide maturation dehydrogenase
MSIKCGHITLIEFARQQSVNLANLIDGGTGIEERAIWRCHAAHLDSPVSITEVQLHILEHVHARISAKFGELKCEFPEREIFRLLSLGLLLDDEAADNPSVQRDNAIQSMAVDPISMGQLMHSRWSNVDLVESRSLGNSLPIAEIVSRFGAPPTHDYRRTRDAQYLTLDEPLLCRLSPLLQQRRSCREFSDISNLAWDKFSTLMYLTWGATHTSNIGIGVAGLRKNSPSGGGLHPVEAYVLAQRIDRLRAGLYHYRSSENQLEAMKYFSEAEANVMAVEFLAGQPWAASAGAVIIMTARLNRIYWKYRRHPKALRVVYMDAGHLSQTAYLVAVELGVGVTVSAAINEQNIERKLELNVPIEVPVAAIALGVPRGAERN